MTATAAPSRKERMDTENTANGAGKSSPAPDGSAVWFVIQWQPDGHHEFQGVFASEARAVEACRTDTHCVCPATVGVEHEHETETLWPGAWYPHRQPHPPNEQVRHDSPCRKGSHDNRDNASRRG